MARFSSMTDLARTPEEIKEEIAMDKSPGLPKPSSVATYPYGLCLYLDNDTLEKLGIDGDLPDVGDMINFQALARVTSASENERSTEAGTKEVCRRIELQITHMSVASDEEEDRTAGRRKRFYGEASEPDAGYDDED